MDEIIEGRLWQGGVPSARELRALGIERVIDLRRSGGAICEVKTLHLPIGDSGFGDDPSDALRLAVAVQQAVVWLREGRKVAIHCAAGINRSALATALVLSELYAMSGREALALLRKRKRARILTNERFVAILHAREGLWVLAHGR